MQVSTSSRSRKEVLTDDELERVLRGHANAHGHDTLDGLAGFDRRAIGALPVGAGAVLGLDVALAEDFGNG